MKPNRSPYVLVALMLIAVAGLTLQDVATVKASGEKSSPTVLIQADRSYDPVELMRASRAFRCP